MFSNSKIGKILISFSLSKNWYRLKTVAETLEVEYLKPLQGVRFYNTILVILSHTALASTMMPLVNPKYVEQVSRYFVINLSMVIECFSCLLT